MEHQRSALEGKLSANAERLLQLPAHTEELHKQQALVAAYEKEYALLEQELAQRQQRLEALEAQEKELLALEAEYNTANNDLIRHEVEQHTGAQWMDIEGEPAGIISRTEEEMAWIVNHITPMCAGEPLLSWQRNSIYLRFGHRDYQKGSSLSEVARIYQLAAADCFAMGDSHNDLEMVAYAGTGVAMAVQVNRALSRWKDMAPGTNALTDRIPEAYEALVR